MSQILGVRIDDLNLEEVIDRINNHMGKMWIATVNPEFVMAANRDGDFKKILEKTTLNVADGVGIVWAREVLANKNALAVGFNILRGKYSEETVSGVELMDKICALAEKQNKTVYFFGGWGARAEKTRDFFINKYPKLRVTGAKAEDFDFATKADFLFVARGMKKQEEWIDEHFDKLRVGLVMGVGRSFDYYSGELRRAPEWVRRMGLEWLYSLMMEPKRWKRQLVLPKFIWKILTN